MLAELDELDKRLIYHHAIVTSGHSPADLFQLVTEVEHYPTFIPWVKTIRTLDEDVKGQERSFVAEAIVGYRGFRFNYSSIVECNSNLLTITTRLRHGPLKSLENHWQITATDHGQSQVEFRIQYELFNSIFMRMVRRKSGFGAEKIMLAFLDEADKRHGVKSREIKRLKV